MEPFEPDPRSWEFFSFLLDMLERPTYPEQRALARLMFGKYLWKRPERAVAFGDGTVVWLEREGPFCPYEVHVTTREQYRNREVSSR